MKTGFHKVLCGLSAAIVVGACCSAAFAGHRGFKRAVVAVPVYTRAVPITIVTPPRVYLPYPSTVYYSPLPANPAPAVVATAAVDTAPISRGIAVVNPATLGVTLSIRVDGTAYQLAPGARQELAHSQPRMIEFDRGGTFGSAKYQLVEGVYTFQATDKGWDLYKQPYTLPEVASN